jgi:hypothetical protein
MMSSCLEKGVTHRWTVNECVKNDRVFVDVNLEGIRGPVAHALDEVVRNTLQGQCGGSTGTDGVATNVRAQSGVQARHEPRRGGGETGRGEPQLRVEREGGVMREHVTAHERERVTGRQAWRAR